MECGCGPLNATIMASMPLNLSTTAIVNGTRYLLVNGTLANGTYEAVSSSAAASQSLEGRMLWRIMGSAVVAILLTM